MYLRPAGAGFLALFPGSVSTGGAYGTVTVSTDSGPVEVTPFRREGSYADGRHPDRVSFEASLEEDLARRDFTVNAMALDEKGDIVDLFGRAGRSGAGAHPVRGQPGGPLPGGRAADVPGGAVRRPAGI